MTDKTKRRASVVRTIRQGSVLIYGVNYYPAPYRHNNESDLAYDGRMDGLRGHFHVYDLRIRNHVAFVSIVGVPYEAHPNIINGWVLWGDWQPSPAWLIHQHTTTTCDYARNRYYIDLISLGEKIHPFTLTDEEADYIKGLQT